MSKKEKVIKNSITDSSIVYRGEVTSSKVFNGKVIETYTSHNQGHQALFRLIANSIAGVYDLDIIPRYICGFNSYSSSTGLSGQTFSTVIPYSSKKVKSSTNEGYQVVFSFLVPYSQINSSINTRYYGLYSDVNMNNLIAHISLGDGYKGDGVTNVIVTWTLSIENASD